MKYFLLCACLCLFFSLAVLPQQQSLSIIPEPAALVMNKGSFLLDDKTVIVAEGDNSELKLFAETFAGWLLPAMGVQLKVVDRPGAAKKIVLSLNASLKDVKTEEGYMLKISSSHISLSAARPAGIFYGLQTLRQLLPPAIEYQTKQPASWEIPAVKITDYPRFGWRGLMLDVSRHFFSKEFVKKYIDEMARYKFNVLHLHLTDDQGWRIEIKGLPKLTEVGAWRVPRQGSWWSFLPPQPGEKADFGGFYTQEDIKEIVAYAKERHINILPEIDVPGHSLAAIAAYPHLSATKYLTYVNPGSKFYNIEDNTLNPADERVYEFMDVVLTQIAALFPFRYVHIGGDECTKLFWKRSSEVQDFMKKNGIKNEEELQSYFIKRMEKMLQSKDRKLVGWDEILEGGLTEDATVMSWRGMEGGIKSAKMGHPVIMTPNRHAYLDLYQGDPIVEPETYSMLRLKSCYDFEPVPQGIEKELILGGQGNLWTESVPTPRHAEYMTWPRAFALAEVFWSPAEKKNWKSFTSKVEKQFSYLDNRKVNYARSMFDAIITGVKADKNTYKVKIATEIEGLDIYYTFDGTNPDIYTEKYTGTLLEIPKGASQIRVRTFRNGEPVGQQINVPLKELEKRIAI
ncbi:MAG: family 20 glycosylhydrolase [Chitinophagaceae bacterium]|nr:family 20 glycosylhydrolase [Chitinophagaceae bacterium]